MRHLMPTLSGLIVISFIGVSVLLYQQYRHYLHDGFARNISDINHNIELMLNEQASSLSLTTQVIANDPKVQQALKAKDSQALLMQWQSSFQKMKEQNKITHFYFLDNHRVCLLRLHHPAKKGDLIERFTAQEAEWSRKVSTGVEVGPMGMLTLRVVQPVIVENEVIGYVEMGKEIEDVLQQLHFQNDVDLALVLRKSILKRSSWEEGMRLLEREADWKMFSKDALAYSSFEKIPRELVEYHNQKTVLAHEHSDPDDEIRMDGNAYRIAMIAFKDVAGKEVGDVLIIKNVTHENMEFFDRISIGALVGTLLAALMIGLMYVLLRRSDEGIKNQQKHLYQSQQRLEQLARHNKSIIWEVDAEGRYTYVSDVVYDVLGYTGEEVIGKYFYDLHPLSGREEFKQSAFEVFKRKESFTNLKNRAVSKDGKLVWLLTNGIPIIAEDGRLLGYQGYDTDITFWQKAEDAIIESRNLLSSILDTIPIRVFWKSKNLRYLGCNTLFARDAGLETPDELIGKDDYQMTWSDQADLYRSDDRAVMESGEPKLFYEEEQTTPEGKTIWLSTSKVPLKNDQGEIFGILGVYEDITEQKELKETLRCNAEMLNQAQHLAKMGSWALDLVTQKLAWSDEVFRIFELDPDRFVPSYEAFVERIFPEDRELVNNAYMSSLATKEPYEIVHRLLMDDGRIKWVHESGISEFAEDGKPLRSLGTVHDITDRKLAEEKINQLSFFDSLTQLPNRKLLINHLNQARLQSGRHQQFGGLLLIDLDHFKTLNDTLGHGMGDILLKQASERLIRLIREGDSIARLGGDEFVILLTNLTQDEKHAAVVCETVGKTILNELHQPYILEGIPYQSTASIGITLFNSDAISDDELMKQADLAMYKSKESGRNALSFFDPQMESALRERSKLEEEIRRGIDERQFVVYYQPQVDDNGSIYGAEALVRWNHPERGMISPAEFIPIAEETGLIVPLGEAVLESACRQIALWNQLEPFNELTVSVNVSPRQFNQSDFIESVMRILDQTQTDVRKLKLELTESLLVQDIDDVIAKMEYLKGYGISFALDDFGTGYSSLSYLKRLPFDQLKIDQGFVRDILSDSNDAVICRSTIALSESMGLSVIAEGVETIEQVRALEDFGCHAFQGYYFSRPLAVDAFESYVLNGSNGQ